MNSDDFPTEDDLYEMMRNSKHRLKKNMENALSTDPLKHACTGCDCPYVDFSDQNALTCTVTGRVVGQWLQEDPYVNNVSKTYDEDGVAYKKGGKRNNQTKVSMELASKRAHITAATMVDDVGFETDETKEREICSDQDSFLNLDLSNANATTKRSSRRATSVEALLKQASEVVDSLTSGKRKTNVPQIGSRTFKTKKVHEDSLTDKEHLFQNAAKVYLHRLQLDSKALSIHTLHDIQLNINWSLVNKSNRFKAHEDAVARSRRYIEIRDLAAQLAVSLWLCVAHNKRVTMRRKVGDGFKSFASGVFFSMRRGVKLDNDVMIIPKCNHLADALPDIRSEHEDKRALENHLAAHKGIRTFHRFINDLKTSEVVANFKPAARSAQMLQEVIDQYDQYAR